MRRKIPLPLIVIIVLALVAVALKKCNTWKTNAKVSTQQKNTTSPPANTRGLNRTPSNINYSKHALCRMDCRHVSQAEVKSVLQEGMVNYTKSDLQHPDCDKKYAVEGNTKDGQHLRIIFAPCASEVTVVTCIDLDKEWECPDCK
ncbi:MAG: DUF4258 domain-containing protein [Ferruginibacter sp.]